MTGWGTSVRRIGTTISWRLLSVPIYAKVAGIGALVAALFGGVTLLQTRRSVTPALYEILEQRTETTGRTLAESIQQPLITGDLLTVHEKLRHARETVPDVRYVVVTDWNREIVAHSFLRAVPPDLVRLASMGDAERGRVRVLKSAEGLVFHASVPISGGNAGYLHVGLSDRMVTTEVSALMRSIMWSLAFCAALGAGLALLMTHLLTRPLRHLVAATHRVRDGDFSTRAEIASPDEFGLVAQAFNEMADVLQRYQSEVQEKEATRVHLLERMVQAQEEERMTMARELHDDLGQSLLSLLLAVQSCCGPSGLPQSACADLEPRIQKLIDDVRRLAWGMRPSILDDYGLDSALSRYAQEMSGQLGIEIDYQYSGAPGMDRLPPRIEVTLYRIAQEAITNLVRHASASRASIVLIRHRDEVTLVIEDNGTGFDVDSLQRSVSRGLGLKGMQERAALLSGACVIESRHGQGTTVRVRIPLEEAAMRGDSVVAPKHDADLQYLPPPEMR